MSEFSSVLSVTLIQDMDIANDGCVEEEPGRIEFRKPLPVVPPKMKGIITQCIVYARSFIFLYSNCLYFMSSL